MQFSYPTFRTQRFCEPTTSSQRIVVALLLPILAGCGWSPAPQAKMPRFFVADSRLYAIVTGGSYGTEGPIYTTDDAGRSWRRVEAPQAASTLAGNGHELFALTSKGEIWKKATEEGRWEIVKQGRSNALGGGDYLYAILASKDRTLCVSRNDGVELFDQSGERLDSFPAPQTSSSPFGHALFVRAQFAGPDEKAVVFDANPFAVYVLDLAERKLIRWTEGMEENAPQGMTGPCLVVPHGEGFLARTYDGTYVADGLLKPWRRLSEPMGAGNGLLTNHCRAVCTFDASTDRWLMADDSGIHLMQGAEKLKTVFADKRDELDLIVDITPFAGQYFISFARLKQGILGAVVSSDLSHWETITLGEESP